MCCDDMRELLGPYVDGEVSPDTCAAIDAHICACEHCRYEVGRLQELGNRIQAGGAVCIPPALWERIEGRLCAAPMLHPDRRRLGVRLIVAAAACLVLAVGGGYLFLTQGMATRAEAATVDFSKLLDGLPVDAERAFREFVQFYKGRHMTAPEVRRHASQLNFELPQTLPGGFELDEAFGLQIGDAPAAAAIYRRAGEFVGTIFHRAIHQEDYGTHRDHACVIGEHRGHRVQVGDWRLVHVTDATTCHCVLSRLDEAEELPAILRSVAPDFKPGTDGFHP